MTQIWSIFKHMFENTVHLHTHYKKIPVNKQMLKNSSKWAAFSNTCLKMDHIFKHLFENGPYLYFQTRHWLVFQISPFSRGRKLPNKAGSHLAANGSSVSVGTNVFDLPADTVQGQFRYIVVYTKSTLFEQTSPVAASLLDFESSTNVSLH